MEVTVAKSAGFCFGVKRAVDTVYREIESGEKPVYTFGTGCGGSRKPRRAGDPFGR